MIKIELFDYAKDKILMKQPKYANSVVEKGSTTIFLYL